LNFGDLSTEQVSGFTTTMIGNLTTAQGNALTVVRSRVLSDAQIAAFSALTG
jgi:hypothetical protein